MPKLLRIREVLAQTGLRRTTLYAKIRRGEFPPPRRLGQRAVAWASDDVEDWIASLPIARAEADDGGEARG